ncbi:MAG: YceI family protein [Maribacter dokdonensis]|jgi:polyisoprenoid-binding protein YceI|uniref:Polyisoprenoid-binding protein YceI n=2 Tax=Maribacter dokdonensis TaxID=320912 RepID=A0A1H4J8G8_9FLAO|nr:MULTISPECIES: YceI family protein [Maribacter]SDR95319.1 Polyisoprenoid-binding protein YceI [Maribacter dokdonensis]SEB42563.1 Polyisoprenoid-binding protein YceI [Maribacter dokdonensis]|tara:strand:+ start:383 stop:964 length:582 start_codon:yes stop_codon:yes gene_type:complete
MKKSLLSLVFVAVFGFSATATTPIDGEKKEVKVSESKVTWKGYKVTGSHDGNINLKSGHLEMKGKKLVGGEFVVDMTSIVVTDLEAGKGKEKLEGHLKSADFFGVESNPTSKLVFTSVKPMNDNSYTVTGDLTIKGITKPVTLVVSMFENKASATLKIDRTKYDIKYGSGSFFDNLGDKAIYDDFDLVVDLAL